MPYNFKISQSILKSYFIVSLPIIAIMAIMYFIIFWAYKDSVEQDKTMQMTNAVQLRMADIESQLNYYTELENNFNNSVNAFGMVNEHFEYKFFKQFTTEALEKVPEITSFWIWFSPSDAVFFPPTTIDSSFNWTARNGFFMRCYRKKADSSNSNNVFHFQKINATAFGALMQSESFTGPMQNKELTFSEPYICDYIPSDNGEKHWITSFSSPIIDSRHNVIGITGFDIQLEDIAKQINSLATNVYTKVCLLSKGGVYFSHFDPTRLGVHVKNNSLFRNQRAITDSIMKNIASNNSFNVDVINEGLTGIDTTARNNTIHFNNLQITHTKNNYVTTAVFMSKARFEVDYTQFKQTMFIYATVTILLTLLFMFALVIMCSNVLHNRMYVEFSGLNKSIE